jgi:hypothetical protein
MRSAPPLEAACSAHQNASSGEAGDGEELLGGVDACRLERGRVGLEVRRGAQYPARVARGAQRGEEEPELAPARIGAEDLGHFAFRKAAAQERVGLRNARADRGRNVTRGDAAGKGLRSGAEKPADGIDGERHSLYLSDIS